METEHEVKWYVDKLQVRLKFLDYLLDSCHVQLDVRRLAFYPRDGRNVGLQNPNISPPPFQSKMATILHGMLTAHKHPEERRFEQHHLPFIPASLLVQTK